MIFSLLVWLLLPLLALVLLIDLATMGTERRAQMLRRSGLSQASHRATSRRQPLSRAPSAGLILSPPLSQPLPCSPPSTLTPSC
jgi:hypothetical protein